MSSVESMMTLFGVRLPGKLSEVPSQSSDGVEFGFLEPSAPAAAADRSTYIAKSATNWLNHAVIDCIGSG